MKNFITHKGAKRNEQVAQGAYDGRYKPRIVQDKKKKANKMACRGKHIAMFFIILFGVSSCMTTMTRVGNCKYYYRPSMKDAKWRHRSF